MPKTSLQSFADFVVTVAYEDKDAGINGKKVCDYFSRHLRDEFSCRVQLYSFEILRLRVIRQIAAADGVFSQLIVIAAGKTGRVPDELYDWIDTVVSRRINTLPVLVLQNGAPLDAKWNTLCERLHELKAGGLVEFVVAPAASCNLIDGSREGADTAARGT